MVFSEINVPFLTKEFIEKQAEDFRGKYWGDTVPVDIEKIIDIKLCINIIPIPEMENICGANMVITSDWQSIYVDKKMFDDERWLNRLRFSFAHEIGHLVLHRDVYQGFQINSYEDFIDFFNVLSDAQHYYFEKQAEIFAGYLLAPRKLLKATLDREMGKKMEEINGVDRGLLKEYIAVKLAKDFCISEKAMEICLNDLI
jgi:Zn-dependent peptidase ImmA (M78 family)